MMAWIFSASILSTFVSTRLTKKLATLETLLRSPPFWCSFSSPERYASTTSSYRSTAKISVMLMLALGDLVLDRGQAFFGRRDLDHDVGSPAAVAQVFGHRDRAS